MLRDEAGAAEMLEISLCYLMMANNVVDTPFYRSDPLRFSRPLLNTLGQGIEAFLKSLFLKDGIETRESLMKPPYRHNLCNLWMRCPDPDLRPFVIQHAHIALADAIQRGIAEPISDVTVQFEQSLKVLSDLHSGKGHVLRYLAPPRTLAPLPGWLAKTFCAAAHSFE